MPRTQYIYILIHIIIVNGDNEDIMSRFVNNTEAIAFALNNIDDSLKNFGSSIEMTNTSSNVAVEE